MRHDLTDADVLLFLQAGCNENELAAYAGCGVTFAHSWLRRVRVLFAKPENPVHNPEVSRESTP